MACRVIQEGKLPDRTLRGQCTFCNCVVESDQNDEDQADGAIDQTMVKCPTRGCGREINLRAGWTAVNDKPVGVPLRFGHRINIVSPPPPPPPIFCPPVEPYRVVISGPPQNLGEYDYAHDNGCGICRDPNCDNPGDKH